MRELSLHVLDLLENSVRAGAGQVFVTVSEWPERGRLVIRVEDDGPGLAVPLEHALDPFYTTKPGSRVGLGLSLLRDSAEQAGSKLRLGRSRHGGLLVEATMQLSHIDRLPLGDLGLTFGTLAGTHPELEIGCLLVRGDRRREIRLSQLRAELPPERRNNGLVLAGQMTARVQQGLKDLGVTA